MDGLALCVDERQRFVEGLRRREPLERGGGRGGGVEDEDGGVVGKCDGEVAAFDWVWRGERERELSSGLRVDDRVDCKSTRVEGEWAGVRGWEGEKSGGVDGGGREVEEEREGNVGGEWVSRIGERVRVDRCHRRKSETNVRVLQMK